MIQDSQNKNILLTKRSKEFLGIKKHEKMKTVKGLEDEIEEIPPRTRAKDHRNEK
jgi:hypothetical protein